MTKLEARDPDIGTTSRPQSSARSPRRPMLSKPPWTIPGMLTEILMARQRETQTHIRQKRSVVTILFSHTFRVSVKGPHPVSQHISATVIRVSLVVGVCGAVPQTRDGNGINLGDVVISDGVVQYDLSHPLRINVIRKDTLLDNLGSPTLRIRSRIFQPSYQHQYH